MWHDVRQLNTATAALLGLCLLLLAGGGIWYLTQQPFFTLRRIKIESMGEHELRHVNALTIRSAAVNKIKGNFFTADLDSARIAFEAVPWVRRASVRREWPNQLIVSLEEHQVFAYWGDEGRLLSNKGELFTANLAEAEDGQEHSLPELFGPQGSEKEVLARFIELQQWFAQVNLTPDAVQLSNRYAWSVKLNNGMNVELGREQDGKTLQQRVERLLGVYRKLVADLQGGLESVDMRYPNGLAVKSMELNRNLERRALEKHKVAAPIVKRN